jgi:metacaspase-1
MAKGICLSIGLNAVNPIKYGGWDGSLGGCENDARDIANIASSRGFTSQILLTKDATTTALLSKLQSAAKELVSGDILLLFYSGHGGQIGDINADEPDDMLDETWCLFDRMLIDDELYSMWSKLKSGVRVLVMSDSCHSGTMTKFEAEEKDKARSYLAKEYINSLMTPEFSQYYEKPSEINLKGIPFDKSWSIYLESKENYDAIQYLTGDAEKGLIEASIILISGCQENQLSGDGSPNGLFTTAVKKVWNDGKFTSNYREFHKSIVSMLPPSQTPNFFVVGSSNLEFESQQPFSL